MIVFQEIQYLFRIFALEVVEGDLIDPIVVDARVSVNFLETVTEPRDVFDPVAAVADDPEKTSPELREGLKKLSVLIESDASVKKALEKVAGSIFMAGRQNGKKWSAQKMRRLADMVA
jgi:hypothetical protein